MIPPPPLLKRHLAADLGSAVKCAVSADQTDYGCRLCVQYTCHASVNNTCGLGNSMHMHIMSIIRASAVHSHHQIIPYFCVTMSLVFVVL